MIWVLTLLVSCVTVSSTETCNITVKKGKVLLPRQSLNKGAKFRSHLNALTKETCQQGCCEAEGCDTILYTADKVDRQGDNCFLFDCHDACVFRDALDKESNYTVAVIAPPSSDFDLPDFSNLIVTSKPESFDNQPEVQNTTQNHQDPDKTVTQLTKDKAEPKQSVPDTVETDIQTSNNTALHDTAVEDTVAKDTSAQDTAVTDDAAVNDNAATEDNAVATPDSTVKDTTVKDKETTVKPDIENPKNSEKEAAAATENVAEQTEPTQAASEANQPVTVKDNAEKPDKTSHKDPAPIPAKPVETDKSVKDQEESTPTEKPTLKLPNEVPVVKGNGTKSEKKEGSKGKSAGEMKIPSVVVVDKPEKNGTKSGEVKPNVSVEVDIHTVNNEAPETYSKRDVVFWVSVVGGSTLIVLGLVAIIRYYGNKRRRLYSSLTDDYLINGMYSI